MGQWIVQMFNGSESKEKGSSVLWITNITLCEFIWNPKYVYGTILLENKFIAWPSHAKH